MKSKLIYFLEIIQDLLYSSIPVGDKIGLELERVCEGELLFTGFQEETSLEILENSWGLSTKLVKKRIESRHNGEILEIDPETEDFYVKDPLGGSKHPDFLVVEKGKLFFIECKSNKGSYNPKWGSAFPERKDIWIFSCGNSHIDETIIFLGEDIVSPEIAQFLREVQDREKLHDKKVHEEVKERTGFIGTDRRSKRFDDISLINVNTISHPEKRIRAAKVLAFVAETLESEKVDKSPEMCYNIGKRDYFQY